ncbi:MAG: SRPBCC family protein [Aureispira sp.]
MKIVNIHQRVLKHPKSKVVDLLKTLSTENDKIWPKEQWPAMKFKEGIQVGAKGGHGPIRYTVELYNPNEIIQFRFSKPIGFNGIHKFEVKELDEKTTEVTHTIDMTTQGKGLLIWAFAVRSLHNALVEDGLDKLENNLSNSNQSTEWTFWTKFLRKQMAKRSNKG